MTGLVWKNLLRHPIRSLLTIGSLIVAFFLLCVLSATVTTLEKGLDTAGTDRLVVQSAVSLYVNLPASYVDRIEGVPGVAETCRWQWFGGYYKDRKNFFAQFAVDPTEMLSMYPEIELIEGSAEAFLGDRNSCLIGAGLVDQLDGRGVGSTVPITGEIFPKRDGSAWDFTIAGIYRSSKPTVDNRTLFFHWDLLEQWQEAETGETIGPGTIVLTLDDDADATEVAASVDQLYENGPQRIETTSEAEFARQFFTMLGNLPALIGAIGAGVFIAILLAIVNTMLLGAREQTHDLGVIKALGFSDGSVFWLLMGQALFLSLLGGGLGILLAKVVEPGIREALASQLPGYEVSAPLVAAAVGLAVLTGLVAGALPAWRASRLNSVDALGAQI
ncbi:MAG: FtsX-like permease family protein [Planctomycetota bacterium]